jgi:integrase
MSLLKKSLGTPKPHKTMYNEDVRKILRAPSLFHRLCYRLLVETGMRVGDLYNLTTKAIDIVNGKPCLTYTMSKTGKEFHKVLSQETFECFLEFRKEQ